MKSMAKIYLIPRLENVSCTVFRTIQSEFLINNVYK